MISPDASATYDRPRLPAMDNLTPAARSAVMGRIRGRDTTPELQVRKLLHAQGYRYRTHVASLPGRPDLVFSRRRVVIFVHGCFWHQHPGCPRARVPSTRTEFWRTKLVANRERDARVVEGLTAAGWRVLVVWQCEIKQNPDWVRPVLDTLGPPK